MQGILVATVCLLLCFAGCAVPGQTETTSSGESHSAESTASLDDADFQQESAGFAPKDQMTEPFTVSTPIQEVIDDPIFGRYGRVLFPVDDWYMSGDTLGELQLTWYNNIDPNETVEIANTLWQRANAGETVFYDIYTEEEKAEDPDKEDTGLFFFKGDPGANFAVCNAGGGFAYVGAMQDSCPHALEISKRGYNAFALIYRPGAKPPVRIWQGQSVLSLNTQKNWKLIRKDTLSGAVQPEPVWQRGLGPMARRHLEGMIFHSRVK